MTRYSTREAAKKLGISHESLSNHIRIGKVPAPESVQHGKRTVHIWTEEEIENVRKSLPKIANGRKTRWQRQREKQQKKEAPARVPVPHKKTKKKK
jgi:recombinational DNA repair protein RecT